MTKMHTRVLPTRSIDEVSLSASLCFNMYMVVIMKIWKQYLRYEIIWWNGDKFIDLPSKYSACARHLFSTVGGKSQFCNGERF